MNIAFFYSKPRIVRHFSIEFLFKTIQNNLPAFIHTKTVIPRYHSNGLWKRVFITIEAMFKQGDINHITGDIHFVTLLLKKRRTVLTIHDCVFMQHPSKLARAVLKMFWLTLPVYRSRMITVVSQATKEEVLRYAHCSPEKIRVIPNFISDKYKPKPKAFNKSKPTIIHLGTAANKNLDRLIQALDGVSCHLIIVGRLNNASLQLLQIHKIDYSNCFDLSEDEVVRLYEQCDLLAFVSTYEGFGMPILEAQSVGRPVVTSNLSSMPEVAGDAACLIDPFSIECIRGGITQVIEDDAYRNMLINKGWENVKRFSLNATTEKYVRLYSEMLYN